MKPAFSDPELLSRSISLMDRFGVTDVVETGTHLGGSTKILAQLNVWVNTIEVNPDFYKQGVFLDQYSNVRRYLGNSAEILGTILDPGNSYLFFLDAHWNQWPLLSELEAIHKAGLKPVIIIHDFFVPDADGRAKFPFYEKYPDIGTNDLSLIKPWLDKIYDSKYEYEYSDTSTLDSGAIYVWPTVPN